VKKKSTCEDLAEQQKHFAALKYRRLFDPVIDCSPLGCCAAVRKIFVTPKMTAWAEAILIERVSD